MELVLPCVVKQIASMVTMGPRESMGCHPVRVATVAFLNTRKQPGFGIALQVLSNDLGPAMEVSHYGSGDLAVFTTNAGYVARIDHTGKGFFDGGTQNSGADLAESFAVEGNSTAYEPGDVLIISTQADRTPGKIGRGIFYARCRCLRNQAGRSAHG